MSAVFDNTSKIDDMFSSWKFSSNLLISNYDFDLYESSMACRTQLLMSYNQMTNNGNIPYLCDHILKYSKICRKNGFLQGSLASIYQYQSFNIQDQDQISLFGINGLKAVLERLKILWLQGEKLLSIKFLKDIINIIQDQADFNPTEEIGRCYGLLGQWIAEAKSESSIDVIKLYFTPAINGTSTLTKNYYKLAHYADEQYNEMVREYESLGTIHEELAKYKRDQLLAVENNYSKLGESDKLKLDRARKQMQVEVEMDQSELRRLEDLRNEFLCISIRNYLLTLSSADSKWDMSVFRLVTLWFSNCDNPEINQLISMKISSIRSSKFLIILYQLSARLLTIAPNEEEFCRILIKLLCKMSTDHPYHCLHHILALVNTEKIKKNGNRAAQLLGILKKPLSRLIQEFDIIMKGYLSLSAIPYNPKDKDRSIPTTNYLLRISDSKLSIPPFTMDIEVSPSCQYISVPSIIRFESSYFVPGGINAPKVITCIASDGKKYRQLVKGNGIFEIF
jgi:ataxia telangiectasia mutated family protein